MALWSDPHYRALATVSAKALGTSSGSIIAAILAQWTCEKGNADAYPPSRNNPGNLARGAASGLGYPFSVQYPNPQPGNPIVTFTTPTYGALAYAKLLRLGSRYAGVRAAVKAGNGRAFIIAMGKSGYGTGTACMFSAYHPPTAPAPTPEKDMLNLANLTYTTALPIKAGVAVYDGYGPDKNRIYIAKAGDPPRPEVGDWVAPGGDYHVVRMPGNIAGYVPHGGTGPAVPI